MKYLSIFPAIILFIGCSSPCIPGEGEIISQEVDIDLFNKIDAAANVDVQLRFGQHQKVVVTGHQNHIDLLDNSVKRDLWTITFREHVCSDQMKIDITLPDLKAIHVSGTGDVRTMSPFHSPEMELSVSGTGDLEADINCEQAQASLSGTGSMILRGFTDDLEVENSGTGDLQASDLKAKDADVENSGTGQVHIRATGDVEIDASGTGDVLYYGNPDEVRSDNSGTGEIIKK